MNSNNGLKPGKRPTMKDVARLAGVSYQTVSRCINNKGEISLETRAKVLRIIEEIGYTANILADSLRRSRAKIIGLIVPEISNPFFSALARGVEDRARAAGYPVILCNSDESTAKEAEYISLLQRHWVAGILLTSVRQDRAHDEHLRRLERSGTPTVLVARKIPHVSLSCVRVDDFQGAYDAVLHLHELGHRRIGIITGPETIYPSLERLAGYRRAIADTGLPQHESLIAHGNFDFRSGRTAAAALLASAEPPTAIFAANDSMALGAMFELRERSMRIPEDVALVGYDNIPCTIVASPPVTTVAQPTYNLGTEATSLLLRKIEGDAKPPEEIVLPCRLLIRGSTVAGAGVGSESEDGMSALGQYRIANV